MMKEEIVAPTLRPRRYQTWNGQVAEVFYRLRDQWYGHFADEDPKKNLQQWNRDGTHVTNPDWNLKILEFDD